GCRATEERDEISPSKIHSITSPANQGARALVVASSLYRGHDFEHVDEAVAAGEPQRVLIGALSRVPRSMGPGDIPVIILCRRRGPVLGAILNRSESYRITMPGAAQAAVSGRNGPPDIVHGSGLGWRPTKSARSCDKFSSNHCVIVHRTVRTKEIM